LLVGLAAFGQWRTARLRHEEQTNADRRRRITETYSKAITQLASDKLEERLGGIYTLENIAKESPDDYWTVMETLTAFVRERARRKAPKQDVPWTMASLYESAEPTSPRGSATDIAAVLTVIRRRDEANFQREKDSFDLSNTDLEQANLYRANLTGANLYRAKLTDANLSRANLTGANLSRANLTGAQLPNTNLYRAKLTDANLTRAKLTGADLTSADLILADLRGAKLTGANLTSADLTAADLTAANLSRTNLIFADLTGADLTGANLTDADLTSADLTGAKLSSQAQLDQACGKPAQLPEGLTLD
jgi:uncharacterized protein YjbI with pentapeptide repeats